MSGALRLPKRFIALLTAALTIALGTSIAPIPGAVVSIAASPNTPVCNTDGYCSVDFTTVTGSTLWAIPAKVYTISILTVGGGGGGTRGRCGYLWGQGGGGGGFAEVFNQSVTAGAVATVSVGAGGTGSGECGTTIQGAPGGTSGIWVGAVEVYSGGGYSPETGRAAFATNGGNSGPSRINGVDYPGPSGGAPAWDSSGDCTSYACNAGGGGGAGTAGNGMNAGTGKISVLTGARYAGGGSGRATAAFGTADSTAGREGTCDATDNFGGGGADCAPLARGGKGGSGYVYIRYMPGPTLSTPTNAAISVGQAATFSVTATKATNLTTASMVYQWQSSPSGSTTWTDISGANSASYSTATQTGQGNSGVKYRAKVTQTGTTGSVAPTSFNFTAAATMTVSTGSQTISFASLGGKTYGDASFDLSATASSGLAVSFASATTATCTLTGSTVTIVAAGTCTINANQAGDSNYVAAPQVQQSFTIARKALTITANNDNKVFGATKTYGAGSTAFTQSGLVGSETIGSVTLTASGGDGASDNVGNYSLPPSAATGGTFTAANYLISYVAGTLGVSAADSSATWANASTTFSPGATFTVTAPTVVTGGAGTWAYSSGDPTVASLNAGAVFNILKNGSSLITATFTPTSSNYSSSTTSMTLTVGQGTNAITFGTLDDKLVSAGSFDLSASATSGLAVVFTSSTLAICTIAGSTLTVVAAGTCTVLADQPGSSLYDAAAQVSQSFTVAPIVITFDSNFGTPTTTTQNMTAAVGVTLTANGFSRTGYTFGGWSTARSGAVTHTNNQAAVTFASDTTLFAVWEAINYSVTYRANGATAGAVPTDATNYNIGQSATAKANSGALALPGYTFAGWNTLANGNGSTYNSGNSFEIGSANVELHAIWLADTYTVNYNTNGATGDAASTSATYTTGGTPITLSAIGSMQKLGHTFSGWSTTPTGTVLVGTFTTLTDVTLYAKWAINVITITYDKGAAASAEFISFAANSSGNYATRFNVSNIVDTSSTFGGKTYAFVGWNDGTSIYQSGASYLLGATPVVLTAMWVETFGVRYIFNGGTAANGTSAVDSQCISAGLCTNLQQIQANIAPTRDGYQFTGWTDQSGTAIAAGATFTVTETSFLLYAGWQALSYAVTYVSPGVTGLPTQAALRYGDTFALANAITRTGYDFVGWSDGLNTYGASATYTVGLSPITFTAQWDAQTYVVSYDWNGGGGAAAANQNYTVGATGLTLTALTDQVKDGFTFGGWARTIGGDAVSVPFVPTESLTLYAIWGAGSYVITIDPNFGSQATSSETIANGTSLTLGNPVRAGFVFVGWFNAATGGSLIGVAGADYLPSASRTIFARWVQSSLFGIAPTDLTLLGTVLASDSIVGSYSGSTGASGVSVSVPAGSLPVDTVVSVNLIGDTTYARSLLTSANNLILSIAVSWVTTAGTVPETNLGTSIALTLTNSAIRAGALIYSVQSGVATLLGTATTNGTLTVQLTQDPGVYVVATLPSAPLNLVSIVTETSATISWSAPNTDGGDAITSYTVTVGSAAPCVTITLSCVFANLTAGTQYAVSAIATNSVGSSTAATATFTTLAAIIPTPPVGVPPVIVPPVVVPPVVIPPVVVPETQAPTKPVLQVVAKHVASVLANNVPVLTGAFVISPVLFDPYSSKLDAKDYAALRQAVQILKGKQGVLLVTGFIKYEGKSSALNPKLALIRAKNVSLALAKLGVKVKIGYAGYGPQNTKTPRATDRKVELRWVAAS